MKTMRFDVECVRECLAQHGVVFTVRKWRSYDITELVEVDRLGICVKQRIKQISCMQDLTPFVHSSGFANAIAWWLKVLEFGACNGFLYRVCAGEKAKLIKLIGRRAR